MIRLNRCPWAGYDDAVPGSLRLLPPEHAIAELQRDYDGMRAMLFGIVPSSDEIVDGLSNLETEINSLYQINGEV